MDIDAARKLFLLQRDSAIKRRIPFRLSFADWTALLGDRIDDLGSSPGDSYIECIDRAGGYVDGNVRVSRRGAQ
jgi:hypothetical protein